MKHDQLKTQINVAVATEKAIRAEQRRAKAKARALRAKAKSTQDHEIQRKLVAEADRVQHVHYRPATGGFYHQAWRLSNETYRKDIPEDVRTILKDVAAHLRILAAEGSGCSRRHLNLAAACLNNTPYQKCEGSRPVQWDEYCGTSGPVSLVQLGIAIKPYLPEAHQDQAEAIARQWLLGATLRQILEDN